MCTSIFSPAFPRERETGRKLIKGTHEHVIAVGNWIGSHWEPVKNTYLRGKGVAIFINRFLSVIGQGQPKHQSNIFLVLLENQAPWPEKALRQRMQVLGDISLAAVH